MKTEIFLNYGPQFSRKRLEVETNSATPSVLRRVADNFAQLYEAMCDTLPTEGEFKARALLQKRPIFKEKNLLAGFLAVCQALPETDDTIVPAGKERRGFYRWRWSVDTLSAAEGYHAKATKSES
jgi:hypothetical protein